MAIGDWLILVLNLSRDNKPLVALPNLRTAKRILSNLKFGAVVQNNSSNQLKTTQNGRLVLYKQTYATNMTNMHPLNIMGILAMRPPLQIFKIYIVWLAGLPEYHFCHVFETLQEVASIDAGLL